MAHHRPELGPMVMPREETTSTLHSPGWWTVKMPLALTCSYLTGSEIQLVFVHSHFMVYGDHFATMHSNNKVVSTELIITGMIL